MVPFKIRNGPYLIQSNACGSRAVYEFSAMANPGRRNETSERENSAAAFIMAAILFIIVFAAINAQSIVLGIQVALL